MDTAAAILDAAQVYLHDDGTIWSRAELLDYLNDGYKRLLTETTAIRALLCLDVPPRYPFVITHPWERQQHSGRDRQWTWATMTEGGYECTHRWEIEHLAGGIPADGEAACTQAWERLYSLTVDRADRYSCPDGHLRTYRLAFDGKRVYPTSPAELDDHSGVWETQAGTPTWYHGDLGDVKQFGLYESVTEDAQSIEAAGEGLGVPRTWNGDRTYAFAGSFGEGYAFTATGDHPNSGLLPGPGYKLTKDTTGTSDYQAMYVWEKEQLEGTTLTAESDYIFSYPWESGYAGLPERTLSGLGIVRSAEGERQYLLESKDSPGYEPLGTIRYWSSSEGNLLMDYAVSAPVLTEADSPDLLPSQFSKSLRFYTLSKAFGREGEGHNSVLSEHFSQRFILGLNFLRQLGRFAMIGRTYQAEKMQPTRLRQPGLRLPSAYPVIR